MTIPSVVLKDSASDAEAEILTGFGFNCYRFRAHPDCQPVEVLWSEDNFSSGQKRPSGSGIPILFPFPGRIRGTSFVWEGEEYVLPEGDGRGNAIHGFVYDRPWRVIELTETQAVGQFQASVDDPSLSDHWPADFRITATYSLHANRLSCNYLLENPDHRTLPCGFGIHPYFRVPLSPANDPGDTLMQLPVSKSWELVDMNATGVVTQLENAATLQAGIRFAEMQFDNVFGGLTFENGLCRARIRDVRDVRVVELSFDETFRECIVYNPPHRQAVCIEPYTCVPDCFRLQTQGIDAGARVLAPGESLTASVTIGIQ